MAFKHHQYGDQTKRPAAEELEAEFHKSLVIALANSSEKGDKKRQGYIMGAFREVLSKFSVEFKDEKYK